MTALSRPTFVVTQVEIPFFTASLLVAVDGLLHQYRKPKLTNRGNALSRPSGDRNLRLVEDKRCLNGALRQMSARQPLMALGVRAPGSCLVSNL